MVIYENGQYDSRYFGESTSVNITSGMGNPNFVTYPTVTFENSHIEMNSKFTNYWTSFVIDVTFDDSNVPSGSKIWLTMEITNVNDYHSSATVTNSDPFPYYPDQQGDARYIYVRGRTIQGRYCFAVNDNGKIHLSIATGNEGEVNWKITKIELILPDITSNGGGATHIAKVTGQLKDLSSNLSAILMVSGGGGGGLLVGDTDYSGKEAGGISGSGDNSADQTTGNAFGQGESGTNVSGGGSGLYGGYKGTSAKSGGAGSGYIGNSLLSNKKMVGYNVPTSSAESTKTESVNAVSASAVSGKPKSGNGFAKIKFLRDWESIEPIVPSEYRDYVQIINGRRQSDTFYGLRDFFWCDYVHYSHVFYYFDGAALEHSFFLWRGMPDIQHFGNLSYNHVDMISTIDSRGENKFEEVYNSVCCTPITDIRISGSGNSYSFTTDLDGKLQALFVNDRMGGDYHHYAGAWQRKLDTGEISIGCNTYASSSDYTDFTFTGTLEDVFKLLAMWCRNVNIYVNNECWSNVE